jgi:hypothetical protein
MPTPGAAGAGAGTVVSLGGEEEAAANAATNINQRGPKNLMD